MFNRNNYVSMKNIPFFTESYVQRIKETYIKTYLINGENLSVGAIISDLDNKQQSLILLNDQYNSFKLNNADEGIINGLDAAMTDLQKNIGIYQDILANNVEVADLIELKGYLLEDQNPSISVQRQLNFINSIIQSRS